ncbi:L-gulono-1,4-lactone dehydrogenase [Falsiruegeria litorea R37]|uniref:L-gulono-1,4-lactone dehydrogenase n=1 Tax=Falsiruegeria litorea R37 TaxID=1200284 RepID=A0A1Y5TWC7_9RHOB|nr:D-arabinono-1,4-lactone oxidase [Falsiruegeria litorea]SLN74745.1 L-gulono-1,4-lactone dehydrogenase [Falsiruegeria litorea R37]
MWSNWGENQTNDSRIEQPTSLDALRRIISAEDSPRIVGAGHSFTPLVSDASRIVSLRNLPDKPLQMVSEDAAWMNANKRLETLSPELADRDLAFRNLGDINVQTLAGAVSTATHGTGSELPCLSAELQNVKMMLASGEVMNTADDPTGELIQAARVSLGALGILLEAQVTLVPKYFLRRRVEMKPVAETFAEMHDLWATHRNFEFFYIPWSQKTLRIRHDLAREPSGKAPMDLDNLAVYGLRFARFLGRLHPSLRRQAMALLAALQSEEDYVEESWRVLCSQRDVRFVEMEYHLPVDAAADVLSEVIKRTETRHPDVYFPIEVRKTAGDTAWLSPFQRGARVSVAIHTAARQNFSEYFKDIEPIFLAVGGRPHWGKMHSLAFSELERLYPDFCRFCTLREKLDPAGKFLNGYLRKLLSDG